jgi:hypothetical protein
LRFVVLRLVPHPDTPCRAIERIEARVERMPGGRLQLAYVVHGRLAGLRIPSPRPPAFADGLWEHTCFEAFVARAQSRYQEYNFSPSGEYAAYGFESYRAGMSRLEAQVAVAWKEGSTLESTIALPSDARRAALSAVIEDSDGRLSYWALHHPSGKPDFHHPDSFALKLDEVRH